MVLGGRDSRCHVALGNGDGGMILEISGSDYSGMKQFHLLLVTIQLKVRWSLPHRHTNKKMDKL